MGRQKVNVFSVQRLNKTRFYSKAFAQHLLIPDAWYRHQLSHVLGRTGEYDPEQISDRVNYYFKLTEPFEFPPHARALADISPKKQSAYYYDLRALMRYFPAEAKACFEFGDVQDNQPVPTFVKSRAISDENRNNILLKLNQVRHFMPIRDTVPYEDKKDILVWRGAGWQKHRKEFLKKFWNHPLGDVGMVNAPKDTDHRQEWVKPKMAIAEQLQYKFILSIEGNDVATNLKWIAQSNSLCFMTRPKFETWMMEGRLVGGEHYVELRDDYADLPEKVEYFIRHPEEAKAIIHNLNVYYQQFCDPRLEELISLLVVKRYLECSGQL